VIRVAAEGSVASNSFIFTDYSADTISETTRIFKAEEEANDEVVEVNHVATTNRFQ
jgi:hypothetical protein